MNFLARDIAAVGIVRNRMKTVNNIALLPTCARRILPCSGTYALPPTPSINSSMLSRSVQISDMQPRLHTAFHINRRNLLLNVPRLLSPQLLHILADMGHGDEILIGQRASLGIIGQMY